MIIIKFVIKYDKLDLLLNKSFSNMSGSWDW